MSEREISINKKELNAMTVLCESIMSNAYYGLFYRFGQIFGERIAAQAMKNKENYFETVAKLLKEGGWVEEINFEGENITVKGSIEVRNSDYPTCHILRGIITKLFDAYHYNKNYCKEIKCVSKGDDICFFQIKG